MAKEIKLVAQSRKEKGSANSRRLRREGKLPGIINNNKGESRMVYLNSHDFQMLLRKQKSENVLFDVELDGAQPVKVLLKEVQYDPLTMGLVHADFMEVSLTEKMRVKIPVVLKGDAPGVQAGGILEQVLRDIEVECLPGDLIEALTLDVSGLQLGQALKVGDMKIDAKLSVLTDKNMAVVTVTVPREEEEVTPEEAAAAVAEGPEVIGKKKEGEEGEEGEAAEGGKEEKKEGAAPAGKGAAAAGGKGAAPAAGKGATAAGGKGAAPAAGKGAAPAAAGAAKPGDKGAAAGKKPAGK